MATRPLVVIAASFVVIGLVAACSADATDDDLESTEAAEDELKACGKKQTFAEMTCQAVIYKCTTPKTCPKGVAGLGKGRKVEVLKMCTTTNGYHRVKELDNSVEGWVIAKCLKKTAAPPPKDDAGADAEADASAPPPAEPPAAIPEATPEEPASKTSEVKEEKPTAPARKPTVSTAAGGCVIGAAPMPSADWWMLAVAALPLLRRRSRRAE